jgi:hypothetical protein
MLINLHLVWGLHGKYVVATGKGKTANISAFAFMYIVQNIGAYYTQYSNESKYIMT